MLIVILTLGLTAGLGAVLLGGLVTERPGGEAMRLVVFDGVAVPGGPPPQIRAMLLDAGTGQPVVSARLGVRLESGWRTWMWTNLAGAAARPGPSGLGFGVHPFGVGLPEVSPRLDVYGTAAVWVWPADQPVLWIDAAGVASPGASGIAAEAVRALKPLAIDRLPVYLVVAEAGEFEAVRRRLRESGAPLGPTFWVKPGDLAARLAALRLVWPRIEAAILCPGPLADAAARVKVPVLRVLRAGAPATEGDAALDWPGVEPRVRSLRGGR